MVKRIRTFLKKHRFQIKTIGAAIGVDRQMLHRRLIGQTPWTAPEIVRFHAYLEDHGVKIDLGKLTRECAADYGEN